MIAVSVVRCTRCQTSVAAVDEVGWCRGCWIKYGLTDQQRRVLYALRSVQPNSVRPVAEAAGLATTTTYYHLTTLRQMGLVEWDEDKHGTTRERIDWPQGERV